MENQIIKCFICNGNHETNLCPNLKARIKCDCGSTNTIWISSGGYQDADASRELPMIETNGQILCKDCGRSWWD